MSARRAAKALPKMPTAEELLPKKWHEFTWVAADDRKLARKVLDTCSKNLSTALDSEFPPHGERKDEAIIWSLSGAAGQRFVLDGYWLKDSQSPFREWIADRNNKLVYFSFPADADVIEKNANVDCEASFYADVKVQGWLRNNNKKRIALKTEGADYLNWWRKDYGHMFGYFPYGKRKWVTVSPDIIMEGPLPDEMLAVMSHAEWIELFKHYAADDAEETHALHRINKTVLKRWGYWDTYLKLDKPYTITLRHFQKRGVPIDFVELNRLDREVTSELKRHQTVLRLLADKPGMSLDGQSKDLRSLIFKEWDWPTYEDLQTEKGAPQLNKYAWERYANEEGFTFAKMMLPHNKLKTLKNTFLNGIRYGVQYGPGAATNTLMSEYNQTGTKCMPAGELVLTGRGYIPVEDVCIGDTVISHTGKVREVVDTPDGGRTTIIKVKLSNGLQLRTTWNHEYCVPGGWVKALRLREGDTVVVHSDAEEWRKVEEWEDYSVSSWGRVRNDQTGHLMTQYRKYKNDAAQTHLKVMLCRRGAQKRGRDRKDLPVHRLVAKAFGVRGVGPECRHLNGIAFDNTVENLRWGTAKQNGRDSRKHGTIWKRSSKLSLDDVEHIRAQPNQRGLNTRLGDQFGVSRSLIGFIRRGERWLLDGRDVEGPKAKFYTAVVVSVAVEDDERTYGLTVDIDHSHVTGGIVTHNSGRMSSRKFKVRIPHLKRYKTRPDVWLEKEVKAGMNMLNFPNKYKDSFGVRRVVCAPPPDDKEPDGYELVCGDMAGFELWMILYWCNKWGIKSKMLKHLMRGDDVHSMTAKVVCNLDCDWQQVKELFPDKRNEEGKKSNFGLGYGAGWRVFCRILSDGGKNPYWDARKPRVERQVKDMIDAWNDLWPEMPKYQKHCVNLGYRDGYVPTIANRRIWVEEGLASSDEGTVRHYENLCKNGPAQGSAADIIKVAQNLIEEDKLLKKLGYKQLFNVYDEILGFVPKRNAEAATKRQDELMGEAGVFFDMPFVLKREVHHGDNWFVTK